MVTLKAPSLEKKDVIEASTCCLVKTSKEEPGLWTASDLVLLPGAKTDWTEEPTYASHEDYYHEPEEPEEFDNETDYYGDEQWPDPDSEPAAHG